MGFFHSTPAPCNEDKHVKEVSQCTNEICTNGEENSKKKICRNEKCGYQNLRDKDLIVCKQCWMQ